MKIKRKTVAPSITEGAVFAAVEAAGVNGVSTRQLDSILGGNCAKVAHRLLFYAGKVRSEWRPSKDHPYAAQECWWFKR